VKVALRIRDVYPGPRILIFVSTPDPNNKKREKKLGRQKNVLFLLKKMLEKKIVDKDNRSGFSEMCYKQIF
jgi:hypothetical protein